MCGIAGNLQSDVAPMALADGVERMLAALAHRGPDDVGYWQAPGASLAMGHRRLAIRDLTVAGRQPMQSEDARLTLVYNGEVYNAESLRRELGSRCHWRGTSDTEVLLRAIEAWGLERALHRIAGMFAFALWDDQRQRLTLVRDRLGIKPLYYSLQDGRLSWSSELKSLLADPCFRAEIDPEALRLFLRFGYVPAPHCIFQRTWKLLPGTWIEFDPRNLDQPQLHVYWDATEVARTRRATAVGGDDRDLIADTKSLLDQVVAEHLAADVPVGVFLSGGIDSALVTALMQRHVTHPIRTFAIGFHQAEFDEAPYARRVAAALGTQHEEIYVSAEQAVELVPRWPTFYCEPFSDTSGLPSLIVCRAARHQITVALTGDGGDELFAGYRRYQQTLAIHRRLQRCPQSVRRMLASLLAIPAPAVYDRLHSVQRVMAAGVRDGLAESVRKTRSLLGSADARALYECMASISYDANATGVIRAEPGRALGAHGPFDSHGTAWQADWRLLENMQLWDSRIYLPNDILHKMDMASMSVGLEVRVPLLDHRLFEHAWQIPERLKLRQGQGKWLLRQILSDFLPPALFERPKRGFSAPLDGWLRGPLREWAEGLLAASSLDASGLLNAQPIRRYWTELQTGRAGHARIWPILVFLAWQQQYLQPKASRHEYRVRHAGNHPVRVGR